MTRDEADEYDRKVAEVALRVYGNPKNYQRSIERIPPGAKVWNHLGVYEVLAHFDSGERSVWGGRPIMKTQLRHESGEVTERWGDDRMWPVPNWHEAGALVWNGGDWRLWRTIRPHDPKSALCWAEDVDTGKTDHISAAQLMPWYGTVEDFNRAFPARRKGR